MPRTGLPLVSLVSSGEYQYSQARHEDWKHCLTNINIIKCGHSSLSVELMNIKSEIIAPAEGRELFLLIEMFSFVVTANLPTAG